MDTKYQPIPTEDCDESISEIETKSENKVKLDEKTTLDILKEKNVVLCFWLDLTNPTFTIDFKQMQVFATLFPNETNYKSLFMYSTTKTTKEIIILYGNFLSGEPFEFHLPIKISLNEKQIINKGKMIFKYKFRGDNYKEIRNILKFTAK